MLLVDELVNQFDCQYSRKKMVRVIILGVKGRVLPSATIYTFESVSFGSSKALSTLSGSFAHQVRRFESSNSTIVSTLSHFELNIFLSIDHYVKLGFGSGWVLCGELVDFGK